MLGFFTIAVASLVVGAQPGRGGRHRRLHRQGAGLAPGPALVVLGFAVGCVGVFNAAWFSPGDRNATLSTTASLFGATDLNTLARPTSTGSASCCSSSRSWWPLRRRTCATASWRTPRSCSAWSRPCSRSSSCTTSPRSAAKQGFDGATGAWDNLGTGAWMTCAALSLFAGAGYLVRQGPPGRGQGRPRRFRHPRQRLGRSARPGGRRDHARRDRRRAVLPADGDPVLADGARLRDRHLRAARHRPQRRRRLGRSARPRFHRVLRHRLLHHGLLHRPAAGEAAGLAVCSARWRASRSPSRSV